MSMSTRASEPYRPWFRKRPGLALASTAALFVAITVLRVWMGTDSTEGIAMLYVLPISLAALTWGRGAGLASAAVALTLLGLWVLVNHVGLSPLGWASRAIPIILVGFILGDVSDRLRRAEHERLMQEAHDLLRHQAVEINDSLVQGMAATKWKLESGDADAGLAILEETLITGQELVSGLMRRSAEQSE